MTEIHERLQPVAEVGENGSNGDDDSINSDQSPLPIGSSSMTRPLFIHQPESKTLEDLEGNSSSLGIFDSHANPTSYSNEDDDSFQLKRISSNFEGEGMLAQSRDNLPKFHQNTKTHPPISGLSCNSNTAMIKKQPSIDKHLDYPESDTDSRNQADDILEYDEDNVVVIDLDDIRNNPSRDSREMMQSTKEEPPKRKVEIERHVYYDDSDLFSPPPPPLDDTAEEQGENLTFENTYCTESSNNVIGDVENVALPCSSSGRENTNYVPTTAITKQYSPESTSSTASANSQNDEIKCENISQVNLPPPIQSVLDQDGINQESYFDEDEYSQKDIVQPPSPFSERSCSSSATTGASSIKQSHCHDSNLLKNNCTRGTEESVVQSSLHPAAAIATDNDQPVFIEARNISNQTGGVDNHSQLTLTSISSDLSCQPGFRVPLPQRNTEGNNVASVDEPIIEHPSTLPPVNVNGRTNLTSAIFSNPPNDNVRKQDLGSNAVQSTFVHNNYKHLPNQQDSSQSLLEGEQRKECSKCFDNSLVATENIREKRDRPNQLFPSVPTSSSVIINNNICGVSPSTSASKHGADNEDGTPPHNGGDMSHKNYSNEPREQRHRLRKKLPNNTKSIPFRDVSTPTAHSIDAEALKKELERERRSASCRRSKDSKRHLSEIQTETFNSQHDILNPNMSYSSSNTLCRNYGGRSGGSGVDGADIMRRTYYRGGIIGRKAKSNDFLDRMDTLMTKSCIGALDTGMSGSIRGNLTSISQSTSSIEKMSKIEKYLYLGSLEAATDAILLEAHNITHIVTVDSIPLPRKMTSLLPRIALLFLQVTDLPDEDLLSHFDSANDFINDCVERESGACLIHCFRGRSRSATVAAAYLMHKHGYSSQKAISKIRSKRPSINPHASFMAQLQMYEAMDYTIDTTNIQLKMFRLHCASERMRKAKILFRDSLDLVLDEDPAASSGNMAGILSGITGEYNMSKSEQRSSGNHPVVYKCKRCRRTLATAYNMLPHCVKESPDWTDSKWALPCEEVLEGASDTGLSLCGASVFINPTRWMAGEIKAKLAGRLYCPQCQARVGNYSWVMGRECHSLSGGCGAAVVPAFQLDVTEIIFRTRNKYLQSTGREPVVV